VAVTNTTVLEAPRLRVELGEALVAGFPQWAVVVFENPDPRLHVVAVAPIVPGEPCPELGLTVRAGERVVASRLPMAAGDSHGLPTGPSIGPGERRAGLIDLDESLALEPGDYQLSLVYPGTHAAAAEATVELHILEPTDAERELLARRDDEEGWMGTVLASDAAIPTGPEAVSPRCHELLRLHARLQLAVRKRGLSRFEIDEMFAALPARFQAPAELLHYELARLEGQALGEDAGAGLAARWPGWRWWLDEAEDDCGPLAMLRERRDILTG
jgi:hypothetical protein